MNISGKAPRGSLLRRSSSGYEGREPRCILAEKGKVRTISSHSPEETRALAADLVKELKSRGALDRPRVARDKPGVVLALHGELGSGKTCFVQGLAQALGVRQVVTSPTFTMVNEYRGQCLLVHVDLYRVNTPEELLSIDFEDCLAGKGITVIEWAERAGAWLPRNAWHIYFKVGTTANTRTITLTSVAKR
ncbi:MAG: tRNA (adenosine(37)-N6)-threonylcarbamoyltransferase complex ATPase subunit type 1 TsaE [Lentisphaerae bacterium]|nr:tRNA (adenosine(37)-N6)-threonylcarbamoyltransferase complex ATPase subunit type 1 TsaE [Lentisphaerota bacterium]